MQWASPMASLFRATIFAIGHRLHSASAFKRRTCPIFQFLCCLSHFPRFCKVSSTSFLHRFQNSSGRCWTLLQCFLQYRSGEVKWPRGGITTLDFIVRKFTELRGARLVTPLSTSIVNGCESMIASTSTKRVCKDSLDKLLPWVFSKEFKIARTPNLAFPHSNMLLDSGGFLFKIIHSAPFSFKKLPILIWSISTDAPTRFEPLSDLIILTLPLQRTNLLKPMMNESVLREYTTSICMALLDRQVYRPPYLFTSFQPSFMRNEPNKSTPQYVNVGSSLILSLGKSAIFCCWSLPLKCLHLTHFEMIHLTKELHLVTQKPEDLIWFIVMPRPAWATCSWHQRITSSAILQDFGNNTGCCISLATADLLILPPTLNIPSSSMNGSNFTMLLHDFKHFPFPKEINSSPKCLLWTDLIIPFLPSLFLPSPMACYATLCDPIL